PAIVPVYEVARRCGRQPPFYTMRLASGRTLSEAARDYHQRHAAGRARPGELRELLAALLAVCDAVAYAHARGILHRHLKGGNVTGGDSGGGTAGEGSLAPAHGEKSEPVGGGFPRPDSSALSVESAAPADPRSDVLGLGGLLYEILTGR